MRDGDGGGGRNERQMQELEMEVQHLCDMETEVEKGKGEKTGLPAPRLHPLFHTLLHIHSLLLFHSFASSL